MTFAQQCNGEVYRREVAQTAWIQADMIDVLPTWDVASDEQILAEVAAAREARQVVTFSTGVEALLRRRGLWERCNPQAP